MTATKTSRAKNLRSFAGNRENGDVIAQGMAGEALGAAILIEDGRDPGEIIRLLSPQTLENFALYCATR